MTELESLRKAYVELAEKVLYANVQQQVGNAGGQIVGGEQWRITMYLTGFQLSKIRGKYIEVKNKEKESV